MSKHFYLIRVGVPFFLVFGSFGFPSLNPLLDGHTAVERLEVKGTDILPFSLPWMVSQQDSILTLLRVNFRNIQVI